MTSEWLSAKLPFAKLHILLLAPTEAPRECWHQANGCRSLIAGVNWEPT